MRRFRRGSRVIRILRAADRIATPWKNGGGVTRDVAVWPEGTGIEDFGWRVSIADVRSAGPFSKFENVDRIMLILEGRLAMTVGDRKVELQRGSPPFAFPGDVPSSGAPLDGAVTDLNIMTRRGRWAAHVRYTREAGLAHRNGQTLIVTPSPTIVTVHAERHELQSLDAVLIDEPTGLRVSAGAQFIAITLMPV